MHSDGIKRLPYLQLLFKSGDNMILLRYYKNNKNFLKNFQKTFEISEKMCYNTACAINKCTAIADIAQ